MGIVNTKSSISVDVLIFSAAKIVQTERKTKLFWIFLRCSLSSPWVKDSELFKYFQMIRDVFHLSAQRNPFAYSITVFCKKLFPPKLLCNQRDRFLIEKDLGKSTS